MSRRGADDVGDGWLKTRVTSAMVKKSNSELHEQKHLRIPLALAHVFNGGDEVAMKVVDGQLVVRKL